MASSVAKRYALAAFNLANKVNIIDQFLIDLQKFSTVFSSTTIEELSNPAISKSDLTLIAVDLGQTLSLNSKVIDFLKVVAADRRIAFIKEIEQSFIRLTKLKNNIIEADLISAVQLDEETVREIGIILQKKYVGFTIEMKQIIKKDILGGLIIKIGSNMIDASLKRQILALSNDLSLGHC